MWPTTTTRLAWLVQKIANSPIYKNNTLIFVVEDDAQDGGDHVDSHRTHSVRSRSRT